MTNKMTNGERLVFMETEMRNNTEMNRKMTKTIDEHVKENKKDFQRLFDKLDVLVTCIDTKINTKADQKYVDIQFKDIKKNLELNGNKDFSWRQSIAPISIALVAVILTIINMIL